MSAKPFAMILLLAAAAAATVVSWSKLASVMVVACAVSLLVGFMWKKPLPTLLA